jgi:hypothetical protein
MSAEQPTTDSVGHFAHLLERFVEELTSPEGVVKSRSTSCGPACAPATGWFAYFTVTPLAVSLAATSLTACLGSPWDPQQALRDRAKARKDDPRE